MTKGLPAHPLLNWVSTNHVVLCVHAVFYSSFGDRCTLDTCTGGRKTTVHVLLPPVQGGDGQWSVGMVMEGTALADRREYHMRKF